MLGEVEHHDDKDEEDHDGPGVDHELKRGDEGSSEGVEVCRDREQRHDEVEQSMHGVTSRNRKQRCHDGENPGEIEEQGHGTSQGIRV